VAIVAKTVAEVNPNLPGTIHSVAKEVEELGQAALAVQCDMRDEDAVEACVEKVVAAFGTVHILINNASALWWQDITDTPMSKYDLITSINVRGTFAMTQACLPHMEENSFGRIVNMSPPIKLDPGAYAGMTAYNISKYGMTMCALGVAGEYGPDSPEDPGITANTLWPATVVESQASINFELGDTSTWRKASVLADATVAICGEGDDFTGNMLIDDEYLRAKGLEAEHFLQYRCDPETEPLRLLADGQTEGEWLASGAAAELRAAGSGGGGFHGSIKRGDVKKLGDDISTTENPAFKSKPAKL
jgi:citronellol/citronellal dehydrogenase